MASSSLFRPGATALITGGASGVGFAFASICRKHGMNICILDHNASILDSATTALTTQNSTFTHPGIKTEAHHLDVSDLTAWTKLKPQILSSFPQIDILMLNAGTSLKASTSSPYSDVSYFQSTLNTNLYGVVNGLATFLPEMQKAALAAPDAKAAIVITGSKQGLTNPPGAGNPAYNMSKSALRTLAEHLAYDLRTPNNPSFAPNVAVHLLFPGWTYTGLSGNVGPSASEEVVAKKPKGAWMADQVAEYAERKIGEGVFYINVPDNEVDEALGDARTAWNTGDVVEGRSALSRWDDKYKDEAARWIEEEAERLRKSRKS